MEKSQKATAYSHLPGLFKLCALPPARVHAWKQNRTRPAEIRFLLAGFLCLRAIQAFPVQKDQRNPRCCKKAAPWINIQPPGIPKSALPAVRLKQKSKTARKKKIAAAICEYRVDCNGERGEISFDFENRTAEIVRLADWDTIKTNRFANRAIVYLLNCENEKLPKEIVIAFEL